MRLDELLDITCSIGAGLLSHGAEIYRVEETVQYIGKAYRLKSIHVFAVLGSVLITVENSQSYLTKSQRITQHSTDLNKVSELLQFSRWMCEATPSYQEAQSRLYIIQQMVPYCVKTTYFAYLLISLSFTLLYGGTWKEGLLSLPIGGICCWISFQLRKRQVTRFVQNIIGSFFVAFSACLFEYRISDLDASILIMGVIMLFVPGLAITNSMRDFFSNDTMAGVSRLAEALLCALNVALGVGIGLSLLTGR